MKRTVCAVCMMIATATLPALALDHNPSHNPAPHKQIVAEKREINIQKKHEMQIRKELKEERREIRNHKHRDHKMNKKHHHGKREFNRK